MKCVICRQGETRPGKATVTLEQDGLTMVVKSVPALVCEICGEQYVSDHVTAELLRQAEDAAQAGVQVGVRDYVAA